MQKLDHGNIMKLNDTHEDDDFLYLVMDLMADDLRNIVNINSNPLDETFSRQVFSDIAASVQNCHANGIIHHDLKLENFLIDCDANTKGLIIKLTDFGLARKMAPGEERKGKSGTLITQSPEQINGGKFTLKADIWSLGVILFELLTNEIPFYREDNDKVRWLITNGKIHFQEY